jgi:AraC-like DNA-binding protein
LSQYVKHYWSLENCSPPGRDYSQRVVPCGLFELIFYLNNRPRAEDRRKTISDSILVTGQLQDYYDLQIGGSLSLFCINFHPHGLAMFLELPLDELFEHSVPLRLLVKDRVNQLEDELSDCRTDEKRKIIAEQFLISSLKKCETKHNYGRIRHCINQINLSRGKIDIQALASEIFLSRKQFERTFREIIGTTPKQFLKVVRFQNAIYEKSRQADLSLTELSYLCGYFDQSHMISDFKRLSGKTPKQFFAECEPFSDYFQ